MNNPFSYLHFYLIMKLFILQDMNMHIVVADQKRLKLHSMGKEEDLAFAMKKLVEDADSFNIQRFKCALDIKAGYIGTNIIIC